MKYYCPDDLFIIIKRVHQLAVTSVGHPRLRFHLHDGTIVEGRYEGTLLGINDKGYHSLAARILSKESDYPTTVELADITAVEPGSGES